MPSIISASTTSGTALTFTADTSGVLALQTGATPTTAVTIDTSQNVGIGTSSVESGFKLHVVGNAFVQNTAGQTVGKVVVDNADNRLVLGSYFEAGVGQYSFISSTNNAETGNIPLLFNTGSTERMRIDSSGNVGIGTSSPNTWTTADSRILTVQSSGDTAINIIGGSSSASLVAFGSSTVKKAAVLENGSSNLLFYTNATNTGTTLTERMRIDSSGNVGIGTSSPGVSLDVQRPQAALKLTSTTGTNTSYYHCTNTGGNFYFGIDTSTGASFTGTAYGRFLYSGGAYPMVFLTNDTERMRITSGGAVCIASTTSTFQLRSAGVASAHFGDDYDGTVYGCVQITRTGDQPDNRFHLAFIRNGFQVAGMGFLDNSSTFAIQNSFNTGGAGVTLGVNATSWGTTSDERKKDIIAPVENALTKLADWRSVYYKYKNDEEDAPQRVGLIAQDVQATLPEAVSVEEDEIQTLQLRYTETIPLLVKAIQELKAELDATKAEVAALKGAK